MTDQLLSLFTLYGVAGLFLILAISATGVPFPAVVVLIAAGSFVAQGELSLWQVLLFGSAGAICGDQLGYGLSRWGGQKLVKRITDKVGGANQIKRANAFSARWGGLAIFLSRWLLTPLGPWINVTSGLASYPWPRFLLWDAIGETLWVVMYVMLGKIFNSYVQGLADLLGRITWVIVGIAAVVFLGRKLFQYFRTANTQAAS